MSSQLAAFLGLYGGAIIGLSGWYFGRRKAKKERALDEVHDHIWQYARSFAWYATLFTIYILFSLYLFGIPMSVPMVLGILLIVHLSTWAISGISSSIFIYDANEQKHAYLAVGILIIISSVVLFGIISIYLKNGFYLLLMIPSVIIAILFIKIKN